MAPRKKLGHLLITYWPLPSVAVALLATACGGTPEPEAAVDASEVATADAATVEATSVDVDVIKDVTPDVMLEDEVAPVADASAEVQADLPEPADTASDLPSAGTPCAVTADCPLATAPCLVTKCAPGLKLCIEIWQEPETLCDDGDPCSQNDHCQCQGADCGQMQCSGGPNTCGCTNNSDCVKFDDGNACNGLWFCATDSDSGICKPNPATAVKCPPLFDDPCNSAICNPIGGACETTPTADGTPCDDGKICSAGDKCQSGKCISGTGTCECQANSDCKDDGNLCNGLLYCDKSEFPFTCKANLGSVVTCSKTSDSVCSTNTCDPKTGLCAMLASADGGKCNDNNYCTVGDHCDKGSCKAGENTCGCVKDADCSKFEAKNLCLGKLFCDLQLVEPACAINPASAVNCPSVDDTQCSQNVCEPTTGKCAMKSLKEGQICDDGNPCTPDENCQAGLCSSKTNNCACTTNSDCGDKDDGNSCNGLPFCNKSKVPYVCETNPATAVVCPSVNDSTCLKNICQPLTGKCEMIAASKGLACDADSNSCTNGDACEAGACKPGANKCQCQNDSDCKGFEDGDPCNGTLFCDKDLGQCQVNPNTIVTCSTTKDTECLHNVCQPQIGVCSLVGQKQGQSCNADDNPCTTGDTCDGGKCVAGENTCSCTTDAECAPYDSANLCNGKMFCNKGKLPFKCEINPATIVNCGVGNPPMCQKYQCVAATGKCANVAKADDTACDDSKLCTVGDVCKAGVCQPGSNICGCFADGDCAAQEDGNN